MILANYTPKNGQQARRGKSIALRLISAIYTPKTAGQGARAADEGHGFRSQATLVQVLEATEAFFRRQLGLPIA